VFFSKQSKSRPIVRAPATLSIAPA
jgi:hypothetical protein